MATINIVSLQANLHCGLILKNKWSNGRLSRSIKLVYKGFDVWQIQWRIVASCKITAIESKWRLNSKWLPKTEIYIFPATSQIKGHFGLNPAWGFNFLYHTLNQTYP